MMIGRRTVLALAIGLAAGCVLAAKPGNARDSRKRVLFVTETTGFRHSSIQTAVDTVTKLGEQTGAWRIVGRAETPDEVRAAITAENLKNVDLVFFANTTGTLDFTREGKREFYAWIEKGGAYAGVHSASDTFHDDPDYLNLVRGEFKTHEAQVKVTVYNQDPKHPATKDLPASFEIFDEIYQFKNWDRSKVHVLLSMHANPNHPEQLGDYPVAWTNRVGKGRMFYTSLGHREDVYQNQTYLTHLTGGILWALGKKKGSDVPGNPVK